MKQLKISSYFSRSDGETTNKRKRAEVEDVKVGTSDKLKNKRKKDKENERRKPVVAQSGPARERLVLSPKKDNENKGEQKEIKAGNANGCKKLIFDQSEVDRPILSPKKDENGRNSGRKDIEKCDLENTLVPGEIKPGGLIPSPKKVREEVTRDLVADFCDASFDESIINLNCEKLIEGNNVKSELSLERPVRCEVISSTIASNPRYEQLLLVRGEGSEKKSLCRLKDMWTFLKVEVGDLVTIKAVEIDGEWIVNAKNGFVILHPDMMMPITSLVNSMYCLRKGVLSSLFKGVDKSGRYMLIGRVVHQLFQDVLKQRLDTEEAVTASLQTLLKSQTFIHDLYMLDLKLEDIILDISMFIPRIVHFVISYVKGKSTPTKFNGKITEVMDIEELVSSSQIGVQGRVDLTVKINQTKIMPLELKTGKASFSKEHKIQVILYTILLNEIYQNVESGLLLYLKDDILEEVKPDADEIRNLLILRNEFVRYLRDNSQLPEPIRSTSCSRCTYSRVCYSYLKKDGLDQLHPNHPIRELTFPDLKDCDVDYFTEWVWMLFKEFTPSNEEFTLNLYLSEEPCPLGKEYKHNFLCGERKGPVLRSGCSVIVSVGSNAVARGRLLDLNNDRCSALLNTKLSVHERYQMMPQKSSLLYTHLTNLYHLMDERHHHLRELLIGRIQPRFDDKITKKILTPEAINVMKRLNREQQKAILKTVTAKDYLLIRGPPGTGKTETIVALVKFLHALNQTVLITGHTHSSVDNILQKLTDIEYLRLGSLHSVNKKIHHRCYVRLLENCVTVDDVKNLFNCKVVASTCLGLDADLIIRKRFDVCLMDESSQVLQSEAIRPFLCCDKFVLVGDSKQLPPVVKSQEAKDCGMGISIFERLETESATVSLRLQYRMNRTINDLANQMTYSGELECGSEEIANSTLKLPKQSVRWIEEALSSEISMSVVFLDTADYFFGRSPGRSNQSSPLEVGIIGTLVNTLTKSGITEENIGIIAPFCDQVRLLSSLIPNVEVNTVDQFQGRDKDIIFFSCTKHFAGDFRADSTHLLNDARRLNVAITRARIKLIVVGDAKSVSAYPPLKKLIECLNVKQIIRLKTGEKNFNWNDYSDTNLS